MTLLVDYDWLTVDLDEEVRRLTITASPPEGRRVSVRFGDWLDRTYETPTTELVFPLPRVLGDGSYGWGRI